MRDALSLMDQLIAFGGGILSEANARSMLGTIDRGHTTRILDALARQDGPALLAHARELDQDAPDYDRALAELAAYLQRIAIVQVVPEAAAQDEEFDPEALARLAQAMPAEDVQLYYQIALGGRRDLAMAPEPRIGFEMCLLRMLAFRPETAGTEAGAAAPPAAAHASGVAATARTVASPLRPSTVDATNWPVIVDAAGLSGMTRQFALNCTPASFEDRVLRLRFDADAAHQRTPQIEEKLLQGLSGYLGGDIRIALEPAGGSIVTPARQRTLAEQERLAQATAAFGEDPAVKGLRERFGAQIEAGSIKPAS